MNPLTRFEFCAGVFGCSIWPILFGFLLVDGLNGKWGVYLGMAITAVVLTPIVLYNGSTFSYIARGSWIVALISAFPILPVYIGSLLLDVVQNRSGIVSEVDEVPLLDFQSALIVTLLYSHIYVIGSYTVGMVVIKIWNRFGSNESLKVSA